MQLSSRAGEVVSLACPLCTRTCGQLVLGHRRELGSEAFSNVGGFPMAFEPGALGMLASAIVDLTPSDPDGGAITLQGAVNIVSCTKHVPGGTATYYDFLLATGVKPAGYVLAPFLQQSNGVGFPGLVPEVGAVLGETVIRVLFNGVEDEDVRLNLFVFAVQVPA